MAVFNILLDLDAKEKRRIRKREFRLEKKKFELEESKFKEIQRQAGVSEGRRIHEFETSAGFQERTVGIAEESQALKSVVASESSRQFGISADIAKTRVSIEQSTANSLANLRTAQGNLANAQADVIADTEIKSINQQFQNVKLLLSKSQLERERRSMKLLNNMFYKGSSEEQKMARNFLIGIDESKQNADLAKMLGLELNRIRTISDVQRTAIAQGQAQLEKSTLALSLLGDQSVQDYLKIPLGESTVGAQFYKKLTELTGFTPGTTAAPTLPSGIGASILDAVVGGREKLAPAPPAGTTVPESSKIEQNQALQEALR